MNDAAAKAFASGFYRAMFGGREFGEAVQIARRAAADASSDNTWGAYQCYGSPGFRLAEAEGSRARRQSQSFLNDSEALSELSILTTRAGNLGDNSAEELTKSLERTIAVIPSTWFKKDGRLAGQIGKFYSEVDDFDRAIRWYDRSLNAEEQTPLWVQEQKWNLVARNTAGLSAPDAPMRIDEAIAAVRVLIQEVGETSERLAILASAHKRRSTVSPPEERLDDLADAQEQYERALEFAQSNGASIEYPSNQALLHEIVRLRSSDKATPNKRRKAAVAQLKKLLASRGEAKDFWGLAGEADIRLTMALWDFDTSAGDKLAQLYQRAFRKSSSKREQKSVIDTIEFARYHLECRKKEAPTSQAAALEAMLAELIENLRPAQGT